MIVRLLGNFLVIMTIVYLIYSWAVYTPMTIKAKNLKYIGIFISCAWVTSVIIFVLVQLF